MANIDWQPLPPLWPSPATWEVRRKVKKADGRDDDLIVGGTADTFEAAKAAALFEATTRSSTTLSKQR